MRFSKVQNYFCMRCTASKAHLGRTKMIKSVCFKLSKAKMEPVPLQDKNETEMLNNSSYEFSIPDYETNENISFISKCAVKIIVIVLMCISISVNAVFVVSLVHGRFHDKTKCSFNKQTNEVCLGCKYLEDNSRYFLQKNLLAYKRREGDAVEAEDTCCFEYNDSLHEMSKIFLLEYMTSDSYSKDESHKRPAAHLTLDPQTISKTDPRLRWNTDGKQTSNVFMRQVQYADDKILIQEEGTYYVYSFITFRSEHIKNETFLNHYLYRITDEEGQPMEKAEMIFMDKQKRQRGNLEYQTSLLAGIVNLESRDRIYTEVSDIKAVYRSSMSNYVGLFKL